MTKLHSKWDGVYLKQLVSMLESASSEDRVAILKEARKTVPQDIQQSINVDAMDKRGFCITFADNGEYEISCPSVSKNGKVSLSTLSIDGLVFTVLFDGDHLEGYNNDLGEDYFGRIVPYYTPEYNYFTADIDPFECDDDNKNEPLYRASISRIGGKVIEQTQPMPFSRAIKIYISWVRQLGLHPHAAEE